MLALKDGRISVLKPALSDQGLTIHIVVQYEHHNTSQHHTSGDGSLVREGGRLCMGGGGKLPANEAQRKQEQAHSQLEHIRKTNKVAEWTTLAERFLCLSNPHCVTLGDGMSS